MDKANGYCFGVQEQRSLEALMSAAVGADFHFSSYPQGWTWEGQIEEPRHRSLKTKWRGAVERSAVFACWLPFKGKEALGEGKGGVAVMERWGVAQDSTLAFCP